MKSNPIFSTLCCTPDHSCWVLFFSHFFKFIWHVVVLMLATVYAISKYIIHIKKIQLDYEITVFSSHIILLHS